MRPLGLFNLGKHKIISVVTVIGLDDLLDSNFVNRQFELSDEAEGEIYDQSVMGKVPLYALSISFSAALISSRIRLDLLALLDSEER